MSVLANRFRYFNRFVLQSAAAGGLLLLTFSTAAASLQLLSVRNPVVSPPITGNGPSASPSISADGRFILFVSSANNLVPGGDSQFSLNLFLRDRASNTTVLVSANLNGTGGGNGNSTSGMISTNSRWVVFQSDATDLVPGDTNGVTDIFVRDLQTGSNILVSIALDGSPANGASIDPTITPDGRYVAFTSDATNLVANDTNGISDIFVRDLVSQTTTLVSVGAVKSLLALPVASITPTGPPAITPDGRFVAFFSAARGMAAGVPAGTAGEVYVRDLVAGNTMWASSNAFSAGHLSPPTGNYLSYHPEISDDGRFVAFKTSLSTGLRAGSILRFDASSNSLLLVATNTLPLMWNDDVFGPEMTPDGRFIAFASGNPTNLFTPPSSVYLADIDNGTNIPVSVQLDGTFPTNGASHTPVLSPDGRFVAFLSNATNLVGNAVSNSYHIYLRDVIAGTTTLVDADTNGVGSSEEYGNAPSLSADGRWVAFASPDGSLVGGDQNQALDVFVRDVTGGTNELISTRDGTVVPVAGSDLSSAAQLSITPDGRWVVFTSRAEDLVTNDFNRDQDVFVRDLVLGSNKLVSVGLNGKSGVGGSFSPVISTNGRYVAFYSTATNLVPGYTNLMGDVFERDLVGGMTRLVSVSGNGVTAGNGNSTAPAMSQDGRYIAFLSTATNLVPAGTAAGRTNAFWRDVIAGKTVALSSNNAPLFPFPPSISADGRYVAFSYSAGFTVGVWDSQTSSNIYFAQGPGVKWALISPNGQRLLYQINNFVRVDDLVLRSNVFSKASLALMQSPAQWSADSRFFAFVSRSNGTVAGPFTNNQVYLGDLTAGTVALISSRADHVTGGNGNSDGPTLSGDGRYVVYRSSATDIASGTLPGSSLIVYDRATGSNTVVNSTAAGLDWTSWASRPVMDATGQTVAFQSVQSGLAAGDLNRAPDIFAGQLAVTVDSDGDGIPDWWMNQYFGHAVGSAGDLSRPQDDADGDGFSNLQEFLSGTDPMDPQSFLKIEIAPADSVSQTASLTWPSVPGKSYQVQYRTNLTDPAWLNFGPAIVATNSISIAVPLTSSTGFYRVIAVN